MSWVIGVILVSGPILSWDDSLYLEVARLGVVDDFAFNGRSYQWVYCDVAVYELNSEWRWCMGLRPIPQKEQSVIAGIIEDARIDTVESLDLEALTSYWIGDHLYECQYHEGPWKRIDDLFSRLMPSYTIDVRDEPLGAGMKAVHGMLYCGEEMRFRSVSGSYEVKLPPVSLSVMAYLDELAARRSLSFDDLEVPGILYLEDDSPLFFYVLEES